MTDISGDSFLTRTHASHVIHTVHVEYADNMAFHIKYTVSNQSFLGTLNSASLKAMVGHIMAIRAHSCQLFVRNCFAATQSNVSYP